MIIGQEIILPVLEADVKHLLLDEDKDVRIQTLQTQIQWLEMDKEQLKNSLGMVNSMRVMLELYTSVLGMTMDEFGKSFLNLAQSGLNLVAYQILVQVMGGNPGPKVDLTLIVRYFKNLNHCIGSSPGCFAVFRQRTTRYKHVVEGIALVMAQKRLLCLTHGKNLASLPIRYFCEEQGSTKIICNGTIT
jgi:hypothetical protein